MEEMLHQHKGALLVVSHDRAFLRNLGTGIIWLHGDNYGGVTAILMNLKAGQMAFWRTAVTLHKLDRQIAAETKWSREGISARRKRNQDGFATLTGWQ